MRRGVHSRVRFAVLGALSLMVAGLLFVPIPSGQATDGRDFAGLYEVTNPTDLGNGTFQVTLTVKVYNYSDADVNNATVTLQDSTVATSDYGAYPGLVSIADRESIKLSADFTISREEYARWQNGSPPCLRIDYADAAGNAVRRPIELSQPLGGE